MTDTPIKDTLDEVITESEEAEQPIKEPKAKEPEAIQEEVETFADKGELKGKTPEELEEIYKNWQRAYTDKRQKETQELKELRERLEKQSQSSQERGASEIRQDISQAQNQVRLGQMSVPEYTQYMRQLMAEEARQIAREEFITLTTEQQESQYQEQAFSEFQNADERGRLNHNSPEADETLIKEVQDYLGQELDKYIQQNGTAKGFEAGRLAKDKVAEYDAKIDQIVKTRTKQSTQMAQARAVKAQKSSTRGSNAKSAPTQGNSIRDILTEAVEESGA